MFVNNRAVTFEVLVRHDVGMRTAHQIGQGSLAPFDRVTSQVLAVELEQVEGDVQRGRLGTVAADEVKDGKATVIADDCSPSTTQDFAGSAATASLMNGKRSEKSWPFLVISRTPFPSRRAMIRNPSCLIS